MLEKGVSLCEFITANKGILCETYKKFDPSISIENEFTNALELFGAQQTFGMFDLGTTANQVVQKATLFRQSNDQLIERINAQPHEFVYRSEATHARDLLAFLRGPLNPFPYTDNPEKLEAAKSIFIFRQS